MSKSTIGIVLICIGLLALVSAGGIHIRNLQEESRAGEFSSEASEKLQTIITDYRNTHKGADAGIIDEEESIKLIDFVDTAVPQDGESGEPVQVQMYGAKIDKEVYIGVLSVPSQRLRLPVNGSWSYPRLKLSPCRYTGSAESDTLTIAAHNYRTHFGKLTNLKAGDEVVFTDVLGNEYRYAVAKTETIAPTSAEKVISSRYDLCLFTCNFNGDARFVVFANRNAS